MSNDIISITIVYALPQQQYEKSLTVASGSTVMDVLQQSDVLTQFPEIDLTKNKIGIFSKIVTLDEVVADGDRIEIYRSLLIDPKQARRLRAK